MKYLVLIVSEGSRILRTALNGILIGTFVGSALHEIYFEKWMAAIQLIFISDHIQFCVVLWGGGSLYCIRNFSAFFGQSLQSTWKLFQKVQRTVGTTASKQYFFNGMLIWYWTTYFYLLSTLCAWLFVTSWNCILYALFLQFKSFYL